MMALVLAGGMPQITLIHQLRERGIKTVLVDGSPAPVALPYSDKFYQIDLFDIDAVKRIAVEEKVVFLIIVCADQVLLVTAQISEALGLPWYIDSATAKLVSDKARMKKIFTENGIHTSKYAVMDEFDAGRIRRLRYPLVVKPVDAYSSKGVRKVLNEEELKSAFEEARNISRTKNVIVEEFFEGEEISIDLFLEDGRAQVLCISNNEKIKDDALFVIFRGRFPVHTSETIKSEVRRICQRIADAFGYRTAPCLFRC